MKIKFTIWNSPISRRIAISILIAAVTPVALLALLTYRNINADMAWQQKRELGEVSRTYARTLFARIIFARTVLESAALENRTTTEVAVKPYPIFSNIEWQDNVLDQREFAATSNNNSGNGVWQTAPLQKNATQPKLFIDLDRNANAAGSAVAISTTAPNTASLLIGRMRAEYVWGAGDDVSAAYRVGVYAADGRLLYCSAEGECSYRFTQGGHLSEDVLPLFLKAEFDAPSWTIVSARRYDVPSSTLTSFRDIFVMVTLAVLLLVALLSLIQIRRTMGPLASLTAGAKRTGGGDFDSIPVETSDEFGELAHTFNDMSQRIAKTLTKLKTLSAIDHEILEHLDLSHVVTMAGAAMNELIPGVVVNVWRYAPEAGSETLLYSYTPGGATAVSPAPSAPTLRDQGLSGEPVLAFAPRDNGDFACFVALTWQGSPCGMLAIIAQHPVFPDAEVLDELKELSNRLAMAIQLQDKEQTLAHQARHDSLTELLNRRGIEEKIAELMDGSKNGAILFIDIDRFKQINDIFGHKIGDRVLKMVAQRLIATAGEQLVGRLGGDEFVIILNGVNEKTVLAITESIMASITQPCQLLNQLVELTCSIGIALRIDDLQDGLTLLERADVAMYRAKQAGRNAFRFYNQQMNNENRQRQTMEADLRLAFERNEFYLEYQPKVCLSSGEIVSAEALVRWRHATKGVISPMEFIHLAEETGLIIPLGSWIMRTACLQNRAWRNAGLPPVCIAVNVSGCQFTQPDFVESVARILEETGLPASGLEIELTESTMMSDGEQTIERLNALSAIGVSLAIDDFGTGYSSLAYLKKFPVSVLKIDQSFVRDIESDAHDRQIVKTIVALAKNLHLKVVAEGVETAEQLAFLRGEGCDFVQGFFISKPLKDVYFADFIQSGSYVAKMDL